MVDEGFSFFFPQLAVLVLAQQMFLFFITITIKAC